MKKLLPLLLVVFTTLNLSAQNPELERWRQMRDEKEKPVQQQKNESKRSQVYDINQAGVYLEKSAKCNYAAYGCLGGTLLTAGCGALIGKDGAPLYVLAGMCSTAAVVFEVMAVNYKLKAGRSLQISSNGSSGALALTF